MTTNTVKFKLCSLNGVCKRDRWMGSVAKEPERMMLLNRTFALNQSVAAQLRIGNKEWNLVSRKVADKMKRKAAGHMCTPASFSKAGIQKAMKFLTQVLSWSLKREKPGFQELPSPFLVLSTTRLTMTGIRHIGVITRANTMAGGGSLSSSVGQSLKNLLWMSTNISSTKGLGHGIRRQSNTFSVQRLRLLYKLQFGDRRFRVLQGVST